MATGRMAKRLTPFGRDLDRLLECIKINIREYADEAMVDYKYVSQLRTMPNRRPGNTAYALLLAPFVRRSVVGLAEAQRLSQRHRARPLSVRECKELFPDVAEQELLQSVTDTLATEHYTERATISQQDVKLVSGRFEELGIVNIHESRTGNVDPIFGSIANFAETAPYYLSRLRVMGMSLDPFIHIVGERIKQLVYNGCKIQFLSLDPESEIAKLRSEKHRTVGVQERIRSFDNWVKSQTSEIMTAKAKGSIELRKYDMMPSLHITIFNDERLFVNAYPLLGTGWSFPVLEIYKDGKLFELYRAQFEELWKIAKTVRNDLG